MRNTFHTALAFILVALPGLVLATAAALDAYSPTPDWGAGYSKLGNKVGAVVFTLAGMFS